MKSDPNIFINNSNNYYQQQSDLEQHPSYFVNETHNVHLVKSQKYGYGIAISGGLSHPNQDSSIYISDIVMGGPAQNKLMLDDKLISVNGVNVENVEHSFVIRLLTEAKDFIHLVIRRSATNNQKSINEMTEITKRRNQALAKTAATVMANYTGQNAQNEHINPLSVMMSKSNFVSSLKPIKVTLNKKDKKDIFGVVLGCQFFVKEILPNSLAASEANLCKGDILVKLNDLTHEQITLVDANKLLTKSKDHKINLIVKRNSTSDSSGPSSLTSNSDDDLIDENPIQMDQVDQVKTQFTNNYNISTPIIQKTEQKPDLFKPINENTNNRMSKFYSNKNLVLNYRTVVFTKENSISIRVVGGNKVGIYISDVLYNSSAERAGLKIADKIFKVNGVDYTHVTREEAFQHMVTVQNLFEMIVAHSPEEYEMYAFDPLGCDSFYIRTHFNYSNNCDSTNKMDLNFKINDILHVTDTMHNGIIGQWVATKLNNDKQQSDTSSVSSSSVIMDSKGVIPNQTNAELLVSNAKTIDQVSATNNNFMSMITNGHSNMSLGASARMSIRKKLGGKGSLAKRSKSASRSNANSDNESNASVKVSKTNTFYGSKYHTYEKVILKEANFSRPVVIFGPLADVARERLKAECPNKFEIPESYSTSSNEDPNSQTSGVIKLASIRSIMDKNRHALLDITPNAVDHLNYAQYFPICIYLKANSHSHVKELRTKNAKNMKPKSSKRLYENALRLNTFYSHLFTCNLSLESNNWFKKLKEVIDSQQEQPLWISQDLEHLLANNNQVNSVKQTNYQNNYDLTLQQQKFVAKQNQLLQQQKYLLDDNFEFPIYTAANIAASFGNGASSTYSLYEDNNYRSSIAASDSDLNAAGLMNNTNSSSPLIMKNDSIHNTSQPIYSTNFHNNRNLNEKNISNDNKIEDQQTLLTRVHSDPNLIAAVNISNQQQMDQQKQYQMAYQNDYRPNQNSSENWKKFHTYSANSLKNLLNSNPEMLNEQAEMLSQQQNYNKSSTPLSSTSSTFNINNKNRSQNIYQQNETNQRRLSSNMDHISAPIPIQQPYANYKLIKNSQSNLIHKDQRLNNNNSLLQPITMNNQIDQLKLNDLSLNQADIVHNKLINDIKGESSSSTSSILSQYDSVDNSSNITNTQSEKQSVMSQFGNDFKLIDRFNLKNSSNYGYNRERVTNYYQNQTSLKNCMQMNTNNSNQNMNGSKFYPMSQNNTNTNTNDLLRRKKDTPPAKPPPPTLPKPKFILPQTSATSLVLQRNLKAKSELNIAAVENSSSSASSVISSKITPTEEIQQQNQIQYNKQVNQTKINSSLVSSSQGYHSDTWDSHSSRQSFETDLNPPHPASRYKHFNKLTSKLAAESKLAKNSILTNNNSNNGSTSDGSITGSGTDDTDSIPNCITMDEQSRQHFHKSIMIEKPTISSTSSTASSNCCGSNSSSSSTTSSAAAMSNATTLSTHSSNSFSAAVASVIQHSNEFETIKKINESPQKISNTISNKRNGSIELPIFYQPTPANPMQLLNESKCDEKLNQSLVNRSNFSTLSKLTNNNPSSANCSFNSSPINNHNSNQMNNSINKNRNSYCDLYSNETPKYSRLSNYTAHYNDNGFYRKLSLDSNSNCSIIASANGIFDHNGGILESADTGVSINVPEGAIAPGCNFDLYFKVCQCKSNITNGKGELLTNPIVMCGPRGIKFHKPIELQIPHFISIDGQSWSYAFKTSDNLADDSYTWGSRFHKKTLLNSVTVLIDSF